MPLSCHDLSFRYRGAAEPVLSGLSLRFDSLITAIIGPNGAGKSTLLRLLGGLEDRGCRSGRIELDGIDITKVSMTERVQRIAYLSQTPRLAAPLSVREAVAIGRVHLRRDDDAVEAALNAVALVHRANDRFDKLSVGQRQLAAYARTRAQFAGGSSDRDRFLLADEPIAALDPQHAVRLARLIRENASRGIRCVMVVHDLGFAAQVADHVICLSADGKLMTSGSPREILSANHLRKLFDCDFDVSDGMPRPDYGKGTRVGE